MIVKYTIRSVHLYETYHALDASSPYLALVVMIWLSDRDDEPPARETQANRIAGHQLSEPHTRALPPAKLGMSAVAQTDAKQPFSATLGSEHTDCDRSMDNSQVLRRRYPIDRKLHLE